MKRHEPSGAGGIRRPAGKAVSEPRITPMPLARIDRPFEHPDWIFEPKLDSFRAVAYVEDGACSACVLDGMGGRCSTR